MENKLFREVILLLGIHKAIITYLFPIEWRRFGPWSDL